MSNEQAPRKSHLSQMRLPLPPVIELPVPDGEMLKPKELIGIKYKGGAKLTLNDRRIYNKLLRNAHGPRLGIPEERFSIPLSELRVGHTSNDRIGESIERLMTTLAILRSRDGTPDGQVQLLGWNDFADASRTHGVLRYEIHPDLCEVLASSIVYARLQMDVMQMFNSVYAFTLYETIALRRKLSNKTYEEFTIAELRDEVLYVPKGKLVKFAQIKRRALDKAVEEINAIAPFMVDYTLLKSGRKVSGVRFHWWEPGLDEQKAKYREIQARKGNALID